jgi:hypothetical protein
MFESKIISRQFVDDFVDFDLVIVEPLKKGWFLNETDVILLRHPGGEHSVMGKVSQFQAQYIYAASCCPKSHYGASACGFSINTMSPWEEKRPRSANW